MKPSICSGMASNWHPWKQPVSRHLSGMVTLYVYSLTPRIASGSNPDGCQVNIPKDQLFIFENSPSGFSNIFRYKLLLEEGGWWVDTDFVCQADEIPVCKYFWAEQAPGEINGGVFKFPRGDARLSRLLDLGISRAKKLRVWGQLGPHLLQEVLRGDIPEGHLGGTDLVYPIYNEDIHFFWLPEFSQLVANKCAGSMFIHLWHAMFARMGIDVRLPPTCREFSEMTSMKRMEVVYLPGSYEEVNCCPEIDHQLSQ